MNRRRWFMHFLFMSIGQRKARVLVASAALTVATSVMVSAVGLSAGIRGQLGKELKAYGANMVVTPVEGYLDAGILDKLKLPSVDDATGQLYARIYIDKAGVELIGLDLRGAAERGLRVDGKLPESGEALFGARIRDALKLGINDKVEVAFGDRKEILRASGFVETGGHEDGAVLVGLDEARALTGLEGRLSAVLLRVGGRDIEKTAYDIRAHLKGVNVRTIKQVARAEESFLGKIEVLMALVGAVVLLASGIGVSSTMSATVLERMKEIGLMKALGGTRRTIGAFFIWEGVIMGIIGGVSGAVVGLASAEAVSRGAFGSFISVPAYVFLLSPVLGVLIAVVSSLAPMLGALRHEPSVILRGE